MSKPFVPSWCNSSDHLWRPSRREFLFTGVVGTLGLTMGNLFKLQAAAAASGNAAKAPAQSVIQIYLPGGMAAQETFDPKLLAPIEYRGPFSPIKTKLDGVHFSEVMAKTARVADRITVVRSMTHGEADHDRGTHNMFTGYRPSPALQYPSFGSIVSHELGARNDLPPYVCIPSMPNTFADKGRLECSLVEVTDAGRPNIETLGGTSCYTGGIDAHQTRGWAVRANTFKGIWCASHLAEHAVHFWNGARDTIVERNTIIDCARGVGFGLGDGGGKVPDRAYDDDPYPGVGYIGHYGGVIRNNVIVGTSGFEFFDTGIELEQARGTRVLHNTVMHPESAFASISYRFDNTEVLLANNLVRSLRERDGAAVTIQTTLETTDVNLFEDVESDDYHLKASASAAIDQGSELDDAGDDIDGEAHDQGPPDIGADEFVE
jgi:hypothetical protein